MAEERINIVIREDGSVVVKRKLADLGNETDRTGTKVKKFESGLTSLKNTMVAVGGALFLNELKKYADSWTTMTNRIALNTRSHAESVAVMDKLFNVAQKTRSSLEGMTTLYQRGSQASRDLGVSQQQLIDFTEGVGLAIAVQGTEAAKAKDMLTQLGQALGQARVMSEEFNSINEATPRILQAVANHIDAAGGSVSRLKALVNSGAVSNKQFFEAFMKDVPALRKEFEKARPTFGQAFTVLNNSMARFIGETDQSIGATTILARGIMSLGENLKLMAGLLVSVAAGWLVMRSPAVLEWLAAARKGMVALNIAIAANPIGALVVALTIAATALTIFRDDIMVNAEAGLTLGDYMASAGEMVMDSLRGMGSAISDFFTPAMEGLGSTTDSVLTFAGQAWNGYLSFTRSVLNTIINYYVGFGKSIYDVFTQIGPALTDVFFKTWQGLTNIVVEWYNNSVDLINKFTSLAGIAPLEKSDFYTIVNPAEGAMKDLGDNIAKNFDFTRDRVGEAFDFIKDKTKSIRDELTMGAVVRATGRNAKDGVDLNAAPTDTLGAPVDEKALEKARKALEKLKNEFNSLRGSLDPIWEAQQRVAEGVLLINKAHSAGVAGAENPAALIAKLRKEYEDAINPLAAYSREQSKNMAIAQLSAKAREVESEVQRRSNDLKTKGVPITDALTASLRGQVVEEQKLTILRAARDQIDAETSGSLEALTVRQQALTMAYNEGSMGLELYNLKMRDVGTTMASMANDTGMGDSLTIMREALGEFVSDYTTVASGIADITSNMMGTMADGVSSAFANAIVKGEDLRETMSSLAQTIVTDMIASLIKLGVQYAINAALGTATATAATAANVTMAAASAAAWAPAAAAASLASFGANSVPAISGMATAYAASSAFSMLPGFKTGGQFDVGGGGGADSQLVAFRASPNERVTIETPHQQAQTDSAGAQVAPVNLKIVNLQSMDEFISAMKSTQGEEVIMNTLRRNKDQL